MDARDYLNSTFLKKQDVRASGPQRLTIAAVESAEGLPRNGKPARPELHLVFADGRRFGLRADVNLRRMLEAFSADTQAWCGKTIEIYFNPDVTNPSGGEPGGLRLRVPEPGPAPGRAFTFQSELDAPLATPTTPAKAAAPGTPAPDTDDTIPF